MNKYQEALDELEKMKQNHLQLTKEKYSHEPLKSDIVARRETHYKKVEIALRELVDRATPKKFDINKINTHYDYSQEKYETIIPCPNCGSDILLGNGFKFCPHCGQALDWEKEGK